MNTLFSISQLKVQPHHRCILSIPALNLPEGENTAIIGPNGAGKSTLLRALLGLHQGNVLLGGKPLIPALKKGQIAWVGQHGRFNMPLTVREYVLLGCSTHGTWFSRTRTTHPHLTALLDLFDLTPLSHQRIGSLSGGEQQRANIVRALLQNAPVLLLDEPCNHLDIRHQHILLQYLSEHRTDFTVIMVLHDLNLAANHAQHVVLLNHGIIVDSGAPSAVMTNEQLSTVYQWPIRRRQEAGKLYFHMQEVA